MKSQHQALLEAMVSHVLFFFSANHDAKGPSVAYWIIISIDLPFCELEFTVAMSSVRLDLLRYCSSLVLTYLKNINNN